MIPGCKQVRNFSLPRSIGRTCRGGVENGFVSLRMIVNRPMGEVDQISNNPGVV